MFPSYFQERLGTGGNVYRDCAGRQFSSKVERVSKSEKQSRKLAIIHAIQRFHKHSSILKRWGQLPQLGILVRKRRWVEHVLLPHLWQAPAHFQLERDRGHGGQALHGLQEDVEVVRQLLRGDADQGGKQEQDYQFRISIKNKNDGLKLINEGSVGQQKDWKEKKNDLQTLPT